MPASHSRPIQKSRSGRPAIGTRHLGIVSVRGRSRVPRPAARIIALAVTAMVLPSASLSILDEDVPAAVPRDPERQLARPPQRLADRPVPPGGGHQEQETAPTGSQQLAALSTVAPGGLVPLVDLREADAEAERPLEFPARVQQVR